MGIILGLLLAVFTSNFTFAMSCSSASEQFVEVGLTEDLFENLEIIEQLQSRILRRTTGYMVRVVRRRFLFQQEVNKLLELSQEVESITSLVVQDIEIPKQTLKNIVDRLYRIRTRVLNIYYKGTPSEKRTRERMSIEDWLQFTETPESVEAERVYKIDTLQGRSIKLKFSEKIVEDIFKSVDVDYRQAATKLLHNMIKGVFPGTYKRHGIRYLEMGSNDSVFEVSANGRVAGSLRFGGYFHRGVFHIVFWIKSGNHSSSHYINHFYDSVLSAQRARGH